MNRGIKWALMGCIMAGVAWGAGVPEDLQEAARAAMKRGCEWMVPQQQHGGYWSAPDTPGLSALSMWALQVTDPDAYTLPINRAMVFILTNTQDDGSIWRKPAPGRRGGGLANYNSAICLSALFSLDRPELLPVIQNLRTYLSKTQYQEPGKYRGGIGYDMNQEREYADLSNSFMVYDAMRLSEEVEDLREAGDARADLDWEAVQDFLKQVQNLPSVNTNSWVSSDEEDLGGFVYTPSAGPAKTDDEVVKLRSYGSMTYAGLLSLVYANVDKDDDRVKAAQEWAAKHWTLDENPGMGPEGLYYFFNILTKCLAAFGDDIITVEDGTQITWREDVIRKLLALQTAEGYWVNDNNRWWEANPNLVTAYTILALSHALK